MRKAIAFLLALVLVLSMSCLALPETAYAVSEGELEEIKEKKVDLQNQIDEVRSNKNKVLEQKYLMDQRNVVLQQEINVVTQKITETAQRIVENQKQEKAQYELFCRQVRQEEERGAVSYWSVLFKATSFADLLSRVDFVNEVAEYNEGVIDELRSLREKLAKDKKELEEDKQELNVAQQELQQQIAEAEALVKKYAATEKGLQSMYAEEEAAAAQMEAELKELAQRRAQQAALQKANNSNSGGSSNDSNANSNDSFNNVPNSSGYIWPTNATRLVTSPVGGRASPGGIGSTNHQGIDIGAAYGTDILAAKSGVVVQSGWYGGYGYCVTIQHGSNPGNYTRYGHMSQILVGYGQTVSQGQVIGLVGSTGNSTGAHIHFEIHENYSLRNPLDYLSGWVRGNW